MRKRIFIIVIIIAVLGVVLHVIRTSYKTYQSSLRVKQLAVDIELIQDENKELRQGLSEREGSLFVEKIARNKLNLAQVGERLVVIQDDELSNLEEEYILELERKSPWEQWQILFFNKL